MRMDEERDGTRGHLFFWRLLAGMGFTCQVCIGIIWGLLGWDIKTVLSVPLLHLLE